MLAVQQIEFEEFGTKMRRMEFHVPPFEIEQEIKRRLIAAGMDPSTPVLIERRKRIIATANLIMKSTWGEFIRPLDAEIFVNSVFQPN